jgi:hypothetical protein
VRGAPGNRRPYRDRRKSWDNGIPALSKSKRRCLCLKTTDVDTSYDTYDLSWKKSHHDGLSQGIDESITGDFGRYSSRSERGSGGSAWTAKNIVEITVVLYLGFVPRPFPQPRRLRLGPRFSLRVCFCFFASFRRRKSKNTGRQRLALPKRKRLG